MRVFAQQATSGTRLPRMGRLLAAVTVCIAGALGAASSPAAAHDGIEASSPENRSTIDDPISSAEIDFGEGISDDVSMFLTYDPGDGSVVEIGGETVRTGETTARLDFPEISVQGTYFVRYLAPIPSDGHVVAGSISFTWGTPTATLDSPNPDIRTSAPGALEVLTEPISSAEITFELDLEDDVQLQLVYDRGNGVDFDNLPSETTKTGPNSAMVEFDKLEREGTYIVTYDARNALNGDEVVGATSFVYGQPSGESGSDFPWLTFLPIAAAILLIGGYFSYKRMLVPVDDDDELADDEDSDEDAGDTPEQLANA